MQSTELAGYHGERLKIRLKANPVDDQANQELISFLAKTLGIGKKDIALVRGKASRIKTLSVSRGKEAVEQLQHHMRNRAAANMVFAPNGVSFEIADKSSFEIQSYH